MPDYQQCDYYNNCGDNSDEDGCGMKFGSMIRLSLS